MAAHRRPVRVGLSPPSRPRRKPGQKSALRLCQSWKSSELLPSSWTTPCSTVTLVTAPQTPSLMPKPPLRILACRWSPPMATPYIIPQPAATHPCSNSSSLWRRSSRRCGPAAACHSWCAVMWLLPEQEVFALRGGKQGRLCRREEKKEGKSLNILHHSRFKNVFKTGSPIKVWKHFLSPPSLVTPLKCSWEVEEIPFIHGVSLHNKCKDKKWSRSPC